MLKVYIGPNKDSANLPVLLPNLDFKIKESWIFIKEAFKDYKNPVFDLVDRPDKADFLMVPLNYFGIKDDVEYLAHFVELSRRYGKKIIIFAYGDRDEEIKIPNSVIFRTSQYGYKKRPNEIIMPGYTEDLCSGRPPALRKKGVLPVVSFCGWASFKDIKSRIKYGIRLLENDIGSLFLPSIYQAAKKKGIYYRRKALAILSKSGKVKTNFLIRKSYSGHAKTIELPPEKARAEYIDNIINSDFVLTVKGDGNFSYRFYEALSLGRIPLFVNTDCVLPLEDLVEYKKFVLSVDYKDMNTIDDIVFNHYKKMSEDEYINKQKLARQSFEKYLRIDRFFELMFKEEKIREYIKNGN